MKVQLFALEKVAKIYAGVSAKKEEVSETFDGCPWVRVEDLRNGKIVQTSRRLSAAGMKRARISPPGTVFLSRTGTIGKTGICEEYMAPSNNILAAEFDEQLVDPLYGMYCLLAFRPEFLAESRGAVYDSLSISAFRRFVIPVPDLAAQRQIAGRLDLVARAQEQEEKLIEMVKGSVHALFDRCFGEETFLLERNRTWVNLEHLAEVTLSTAGKSQDDQGQEVSYIVTGQLNDWEIRCEGTEPVSVSPALAEKCGLTAGDLVMNRINQIDRLGRCGIVPELRRPAVFGLNTVRIRADREQTEPLFLAVWLTHPYVKHYIREHAKNSTSFQSSLSKQVIMELPVPKAGAEKQKRFASEIEKCFRYVRDAEETCRTLEEIRQINYKKIKALYEYAQREDTEIRYEKNKYWIAPSGQECFYDRYLECIQVPFREWNMLPVSVLPEGVELQFLDRLHTISDPSYGMPGHIRLRRVSGQRIQVIRMEAAASRESGGDEEKQRQLEEGLLSEQQDFGYIRHIEEREVPSGIRVKDILIRAAAGQEKEYSRFHRLPEAAKGFLRNLSRFQQAVYEEFLLAMQPLASHMAHRQMLLRADKEEIFQGHGVQDVTATVHLLENAGLLERRQGFYLNYYKEYKQGEERQPMLDHRGRPIPIDTWVWIMPKE